MPSVTFGFSVQYTFVFTWVRRSATAAASSAVIDVPSVLSCHPVPDSPKTMASPTAVAYPDSGHAMLGPAARRVGWNAFRLPWNVEISQREPMRSMRACRSPLSPKR